MGTKAATRFNAAAGMWFIECVDMGGGISPAVRLTEPGQPPRVVAWPIASQIAGLDLGEDPSGEQIMDFFGRMQRLIRRADGPSAVLAALSSAEAEAANAAAAQAAVEAEAAMKAAAESEAAAKAASDKAAAEAQAAAEAEAKTVAASAASRSSSALKYAKG